MFDWSILITIASIIGTIANIYKKRWCFIIWLFTNGFWCIYDLTIGAYSQAILFAIYFGLAIHGLIKWRKILQVTENEMAGSGGSVKRNAQLDRNI